MRFASSAHARGRFGDRPSLILRWHIDLRSGLREFFGLLFHAFFQGFFVRDSLLGGVLSHAFADFHGAEVGGSRAVLGEGFVVAEAGGDGVEVELIFPAELTVGFWEWSGRAAPCGRFKAGLA